MAARGKGKSARITELWPGPFTPTHALIALSLILNMALVVLLVVIAKTDVLDRQVAARGAEILCSESYRAKATDINAKALLNYTCATEKAHPFFVEGYNKYRVSQGLAPVKE